MEASGAGGCAVFPLHCTLGAAASRPVGASFFPIHPHSPGLGVKQPRFSDSCRAAPSCGGPQPARPVILSPPASSCSSRSPTCIFFFFLLSEKSAGNALLSLLGWKEKEPHKQNVRQASGHLGPFCVSSHAQAHAACSLPGALFVTTAPLRPA